MPNKRTLDSFFRPLSHATVTQQQHHLDGRALTTSNYENGSKRQRVDVDTQQHLSPSSEPPSTHPAYPFPVPQLPTPILSALIPSTSTTTHQGRDNTDASPPSPPPTCPASPARAITNPSTHLDLLYFAPFIPRGPSHSLFTFLRASLPFHRVRYRITRGAGAGATTTTDINTPRYTTVYGVDDTCVFSSSSSSSSSSNDNDSAPVLLLDRRTGKPVAADRYARPPRPIPACLDALRAAVERETGARGFNFCLVNYYASGEDSIAWHSDDERFLGKEPAIASVSLGARRDFLLKRKAVGVAGKGDGGGGVGVVVGEREKPLKFALGSGDLVLMRGGTQANWLHSVPKRKGGEGEKGRINITFRRAVVRGGTENYYRYNVGNGPVYRWDEGRGEMRVWEEAKGEREESGGSVKEEMIEAQQEGSVERPKEEVGYVDDLQEPVK